MKVLNELISINGNRGFILKILREGVLVCIDSMLYLVQDGKAETILRASNLGNVFLHAVEAKGILYVHEYGAPSTKIFVSEDLKEWKAIITNLDIDRFSKHFHSIAYDPYRGWLIVTLGDGNLVRVAVSEDLGSSWEPLYKGPGSSSQF